MFRLYISVNLLWPKKTKQKKQQRDECQLLATTVNRSLGGFVRIVLSVSLFFLWPPLFFQHCINSLGDGVHQRVTGCQWNPHALIYDNITELLDVRETFCPPLSI